MKLTSDSGCFRCSPKSTQFRYGVSRNPRRNAFSGGTLSERPRAMLMAARSLGSPSSLFRSVPVTNSSISLPVCPDIPVTISPADCSGLRVPPFVNASGLRNPSSSGTESSPPSVPVRAIVSVSIECPNR